MKLRERKVKAGGNLSDSTSVLCERAGGRSPGTRESSSLGEWRELFDISSAPLGKQGICHPEGRVTKLDREGGERGTIKHDFISVAEVLIDAT